MVTVITHEDADMEVMQNPYPGMSLAEACAQLELETVQGINEFQMNILLAEHAYLYENGVEMSYVDEAGSMTEKGQQILQNARAFVERQARKISELFDKLIEWVLDQSAKVAEYFKKAGITEKAAKRAASKFAEVYPDGVKMSGGVEVNYDKFKSEYRGLYSYTSDGAEKEVKVYGTYVSKAGEKTVSAKDFNDAVSAVFMPKSLVADIKRSKAEANKVLNDLKAQFKTGASKSNDLNEKIAMLSKAASNNSKIARESIRVYHAYVSSQIAIVRAVVMGKPMRKVLVGEDVAAAKKAVANAPENAAGAAGRGAAAVVNTAKDAGEAIEKGAKKAEEKIKGAAEKVGEGAEKVKSKFFKTK